jgi:uncharacterized protein YyaL (SSP411 family)
MTAPEGYFYAAQDADSFEKSTDLEPEEGAFYVWSYQELSAYLSLEELELLQVHFTVTPEGNFEGRNVLQRRQEGELSLQIENILDRLFIRRYGTSQGQLALFPPAADNQEAKTVSWPGRIPAVTDTKMIVAWNSLMISGLARAFAVFGESLYWQMATQAAQFILDHQWLDGRFQRLNYQGQASVLAQSEDFAYFIKALLDLQTANPQETRWLEAAVNLQGEFDRWFWSPDKAGHFNTAADNSLELIVRERGYTDNATPSANGIAIANLIRLSRLTDNLEYLERAEAALQSFSSVLQDSPTACPSLFVALDHYRHGFSLKASATAIESLLGRYLPTAVYRVDANLPPSTFGLICQGLSCLEPAENLEQLDGQIAGVMGMELG